MAISSKLLNDGEQVVVSTRTHVKALIWPLVVMLVLVFAVAFALTWSDRNLDQDAARLALDVGVGLLALVVLVRSVVRPFVRWYFTTYTFTDRRLIQRTGFIAKEGRTIPLNRISGVDFEMGVVDRVFGCGTLVVTDASEHGRVLLHDIPRVEEVQRLVADELHRASGGRDHDTRGPWNRADDDGT